MVEPKGVELPADTRAALTDVGLDLAPAQSGERQINIPNKIEAVNWLSIPDAPSDIPQAAAILVVGIERDTVESAIGLSLEENLDFKAANEERPKFDATNSAVSYAGNLLVQGRGADGTIRQAYVASSRELAADFEERPITAEQEEPAMVKIALRLGSLVREEQVTEVRFVYQDTNQATERVQPLMNHVDTEPHWAATDTHSLPVFDLTQAVAQNTPGTTA